MICRLQQLSYALCYVYAISTRSVSIPAPVYCAFSLASNVDVHADELRADADVRDPRPHDGENANIFALLQRLCSRVADFQFRPELYNDDGSTDGGRARPGEPAPEFDLKAWKDGLGRSRLANQMYFL